MNHCNAPLRHNLVSEKQRDRQYGIQQNRRKRAKYMSPCKNTMKVRDRGDQWGVIYGKPKQKNERRGGNAEN